MRYSTKNGIMSIYHGNNVILMEIQYRSLYKLHGRAVYGGATRLKNICSGGAKEPRRRKNTRKNTRIPTSYIAFSGPAPGKINGRLAMIRFVSAMGVELARGTDVAVQLAERGLRWFVITYHVESKSNGLMSSTAEMWNGRLAMLGLVVLALTEAAKEGTLV
ncbi:hypothetical protein MKX01_028846 [Papaver californicum]|nr:hypothetical protein MKX01_028846 [Papaver californicum]